jgi:hypothetical protein
MAARHDVHSHAREEGVPGTYNLKAQGVLSISSTGSQLTIS